MEGEKYLHQYRKLERSDPAKPFQSANYADPRLRFKRTFLFLLQKLHITETNPEQLLAILDHLIRVNIYRNQWDVFKSRCFLQILTYSFLHIMQDHVAFEEFIEGLFDLYINKTHVSKAYDEQTWLVMLLAWYYKTIDQPERAIKLIKNQQEN